MMVQSSFINKRNRRPTNNLRVATYIYLAILAFSFCVIVEKYRVATWSVITSHEVS